MMDLVNCITIIFSKKYDALPCMMLYFYIFSMYEYVFVSTISLCIDYVDTGYIYLGISKSCL